MPKGKITSLRQKHIELKLRSGIGSLSQEEAQLYTDIAFSPPSSVSIEDSPLNNNSLFDKLRSVNANDRECACSSLACLISEEPEQTLTQILDEPTSLSNIVKCLGDSESLVVFSALASVHAAIEFSSDQCRSILINKWLDLDIITTVFNQLTRLDPPDPSKSSADSQIEMQLLTRLSSLLANFASESDQVVLWLTSQQVFDQLWICSIPWIHQHQRLPSEPLVFLIQLLGIATDPYECNTHQSDNASKTNHLDQNRPILLEMARHDDGQDRILLRCLTAIVLVNLTISSYRDHDIDHQGPEWYTMQSSLLETVQVIYPVLIQPVLEVFHGQEAYCAMLASRNIETIAQSISPNGSNEKYRDEDKTLGQWRRWISAQSVILEMLTNCLVLDECYRSTEIQMASSGQEEQLVSKGRHMEEPLMNGQLPSELEINSTKMDTDEDKWLTNDALLEDHRKISSERVAAYPQLANWLLSQGQLLPSLLQILQRPILEPLSKDDARITESTQVLIHALACLENVMSLQIDLQNNLLGEPIEQIWTTINQMITSLNAKEWIQGSAQLSIPILKHSANILLLSCEKIQLYNLTLSATLQEIEHMLNIVRNPAYGEEIHILYYTILGKLIGSESIYLNVADRPNEGLCVSLNDRDQYCDQLCKGLVDIWMDWMKQKPLHLAAEIANAFMDAFAEPRYNTILHQVSYLLFLEELIERLQTYLKQEDWNSIASRSDVDAQCKDRLEETKINLIRFIEYKSDQ